MAAPFWSPEWPRRVEELEQLVHALAAYLQAGADDDELQSMVRRYFSRYPSERSSLSQDELTSRFLRLGYDRQREFRYGLEKLLIESDRTRDEIERTRHEFRVMQERLLLAVSEVEDRSRQSAELQIEAHTLMALVSLGLNQDETRFRRIVPLRAYLDIDDRGLMSETAAAITEVIDMLGFGLADDFPAVYGSWYKRWFAKSRDALSRPEVVERLEKLERAIELKYVENPQSDVDGKQAGAIAKLVKCLEKTPNAALQAGSVLVVKITTPSGPMIQARSLSQQELTELENNQQFLQEPATILKKLELACSLAPKRTKHVGTRSDA